MLYWALALYRQRHDGRWESVPGVGLTEVESTEVEALRTSLRTSLTQGSMRTMAAGRQSGEDRMTEAIAAGRPLSAQIETSGDAARAVAAAAKRG
jgi:hypothetical protein